MQLLRLSLVLALTIGLGSVSLGHAQESSSDSLSGSNTAKLSGIDYSAALRARSYPFGANLGITGGFARKHEWTPGSNWKFGYVRASASYETSVVLNRLIAQIDVYPISILGVSFGQSYGWRAFDNSAFDCTVFVCRGLLRRTYLEARSILQAWRLTLVNSARFEYLVPSDDSRPGAQFSDESSVLPGASGGDHLFRYEGALVYEIREHLHAGGLFTWSRMSGTDTTQDAEYAIVKWDNGPWSWVGGVGMFYSDRKPRALSFVLSLRWTGANELGLF
ncbi:MAG: hypothetical protein AB7P04_05905 [Bacteriovoracia bacterium]